MITNETFMKGVITDEAKSLSYNKILAQNCITEKELLKICGISRSTLSRAKKEPQINAYDNREDCKKH